MNERDIFLVALEITDPIARSHYLDDVCGDNDTLRASVKALFASHEGAGDFLKQPLIRAAGSDSPDNTAIEKPSAPMERTVHSSPKQQALNSEDDDSTEDDEIPLGFLSSSTKPDSLGRLGHYEVLEVLGKGAFGTVLLAFDEKLHRMVAIKVMSAELASGSPARKRFLREARSAAAIRHENVVAIHAVEEEPIPYLVMEYIPGKTLQQFLKGHGPLDVAETLRLSQQMANGLAAAHSQGLIHRDIKPANVLLEEGIQWKVKITDFGLARAADDASLTQSGTIAGTPMYMSPEQAHSSHIDQRSDLFSLGSVLYEMVSGRPPFRASSTLAVLKRVTEDIPRPIQEIIPEVPDWLCSIISKLHSKQPADRYQTANEVAELLARCQSELQHAGKVTCVESSHFALRDEPSTAAPPSTPRDVRRGSPAPAVAVTRRSPPPAGVAQNAGDVRSNTGTGSGDPRTTPASLNRPRLIAASIIGTTAIIAIMVLNRFNTSTDPTSGGRQRSVTPSEISNSKSQISKTESEIANADPDRRAAEWVLSVGGKIQIEETDEEPLIGAGSGLSSTPVELYRLLYEYQNPSPSVTDLPRGPFELTHVNFLAEPNADDAGLVNLKGCSKITSIWLNGSPVSDVGLKYLNECRNLRLLGLDDTKVTDGGLANFRDCRNLIAIGLKGTQVSDTGLDYFSNCINLRYLNLENTPVSDRGLGSLKDCTKLTALYLSGTQVTDAGLAQLHNCTNVEELTLANTGISDVGLDQVAAIQTLISVNLKNTKVTEAAVKQLSKTLPGCQIQWDGGVIEATLATFPDRLAAEYVLSIGGSISIDYGIHEQPARAVTELPRWAFRLTGVNLQGNAKVSDAGLACFKNCKNLTALYLDRTPVSDAGFAHFRNCKDLSLLWIDGTAVSDAGLAHFRGCRNLTSLNLNSTQVTDAGLVHFKDCRNLIFLNLSYSSRVDNEALAHFQGCKKLAVLDLSHTQLTDVGLANFKDCRHLRALGLANTRVQDAGLAHFEDCVNLQELYLTATKVSEAGLSYFSDCKNLSYVDLIGCQVNDNGLAHFRNCRNLATLLLAQTQVTDAGLEKLRDCNKLVVLVLTNTQISDAGLAHLKSCKSLAVLRLDGTDVTDAVLAHVNQCKNLAEFNLNDTQLSDRSLSDLASLPRLTQLELRGTRISLRGQTQLKTELPTCQIVWSEPNRSVAESVLSFGGTVEIGTPGQPEAHPAKAINDLPQEYFQVRRISLAGVTKPLNELPGQLASLRFSDFDQLESLDLSGIGGVDYNFLGSIHGLQELILTKTGVNLVILPTLPSLHRLVLDENAIDGPGLVSLEKQSALTELSLINTGLNDQSLAQLPKLPALERLILDGNDLRSGGLAALNAQPMLIDLSLGSPTLGDLTARSLAKLKHVKLLSLAGSGLTDVGIKELASLTNLESLDIRRTKATEAGIAELQMALPTCRIASDFSDNRGQEPAK